MGSIQEAGGRRQKAGGRRQDVGGRILPFYQKILESKIQNPKSKI
jgi:hypothetical protein